MLKEMDGKTLNDRATMKLSAMEAEFRRVRRELVGETQEQREILKKVVIFFSQISQ